MVRYFSLLYLKIDLKGGTISYGTSLTWTLVLQV